MRQPPLRRPWARPIGRGATAAALAGAVMGVPAGIRIACHLSSWMTRPVGCFPGGAPAGALAGAVLALVVLPLLAEGTRPGERAAHPPAPTTTAAARLLWLAVAAALGRWLAQAVLHPQMELEGLLWLALLPVLLVAAAGLAAVAQGLMRRRGWARWTAVVACSLAGAAALVGVVDWARALARSRADRGWNPPPIDLATAGLFLAVGVAVLVLLITPATDRDFRSGRRPPGAA